MSLTVTDAIHYMVISYLFVVVFIAKSRVLFGIKNTTTITIATNKNAHAISYCDITNLMTLKLS